MEYDFMDYVESAYVNGYDIGDNLEWVKRNQPPERTVDSLRQHRENDLNWGKEPNWYGE